MNIFSWILIGFVVIEMVYCWVLVVKLIDAKNDTINRLNGSIADVRNLLNAHIATTKPDKKE